MLALLASPATASAEPIRLCALKLPPPPNAARIAGTGLEREGVVLETRSAGARLRWIYACGYNTGRTSRVSELRSEERASGVTQHSYTELAIDQGVLAAVFSRTAVEEGARRRIIAAYAATRNEEYRIYVVPAPENARERLAANEIVYREAEEQLIRQLENARFTRPIETTITEAQYRIRLALAGGLFFLLLGGAAFWILRRIVRGQRGQAID